MWFSLSHRHDMKKSSVFWDITPYSPLKVNGCFGGICRLHFQHRRISPARNLREAGKKQSRHFLPKRLLTFNGLHGVISQKIGIFLTTPMETLNTTWYEDFSSSCCQVLFFFWQKQNFLVPKQTWQTIRVCSSIYKKQRTQFQKLTWMVQNLHSNMKQTVASFL
jgi:hypothetical protein